MSSFKEYSKTFYKSTKRDLINAGRPDTAKKHVYAELRRKFHNQKEAGGSELVSKAIATGNEITRVENASNNRRNGEKTSQKPKILHPTKIKKSNLEFFEKFYKLTSQ